MLDPRSTWKDAAAYDAQAAKLAAHVPGRTLRDASRPASIPPSPRPDPWLRRARPRLRGRSRPAVGQHPARRCGAARARYARRPAPALRPPARPRLPGLPRRHPHPLRARPRRVPPHQARPDGPGRARRARRGCPRRTGSPRGLAALLHDIGHYPFSHALEEAGFLHHEELGVAKLGQGELGDVLRSRSGGPGLALRIGGAHPRPEHQPARRAHPRLARPGQDRLPEPRRPDVRRALRRGGRGPPALVADLSSRARPGAAKSASTKRASAPWSRCSSPSTRCTGTSTGTTRCGARPACSSARCGPRWRRVRSSPPRSRRPPTTG